MMAQLYDVDVRTINEHISHIFNDGELDQGATVRNFRIVQIEGSRNVSREVMHYNLQMIIAVGFKVNNEKAVQFRKWANSIVKDYTIQGWVMDEERLKKGGSILTKEYFEKQLEKIREIRMSERRFYQKITDIYATASDYDYEAITTKEFFSTVQNKLHYAAHGHTAAEVIYERADAEKPFMGLTSFSGSNPAKKDVTIAKNYLTEDELKILNNLVSGYFDFAEIQAMRHNVMHMNDYAEQLDRLLEAQGDPVLDGAGKISHKQAVDKAIDEYTKYQVKTLSPVERDYLRVIEEIDRSVSEEIRDKNKKGN